jgi:tetratricopeptide (TPR) repeat protein
MQTVRQGRIIILCGLLAVAQQPEPPASDAMRLFREGFAAQKNAEEAQAPDRAVAQFQKAIEYYRQAVAADPSLCQAQLHWARCLAQAAARLSEDPNRPAVVKAARERFAVAVRCPGVDWNAHADWARLLVGESGRVAEAADRRELLREARTHLELALQSARSPR